jgi:hypothetical protein
MFLRKITDYWDNQKFNAVMQYSRMIEEMQEPERQQVCKNIAGAVAEHARVLTDDELKIAAFIMVDDLYKSANDMPLCWNDHTGKYLQASAGTLCKSLNKRGYLIHYLVYNDFGDSVRPFLLFPDWFEAAGFIYICPAFFAHELMLQDGLDEDSFSQNLPQYMGSAISFMNSLLKRCHRNNRNYVFLNTFDTEGLFRLSMDAREKPGVITISGNKAQVKGSKCTVKFPEVPFEKSKIGLRRDL